MAYYRISSSQSRLIFAFNLEIFMDPMSAFMIYYACILIQNDADLINLKNVVNQCLQPDIIWLKGLQTSRKHRFLRFLAFRRQIMHILKKNYFQKTKHTVELVLG